MDTSFGVGCDLLSNMAYFSGLTKCWVFKVDNPKLPKRQDGKLRLIGYSLVFKIYIQWPMVNQRRTLANYFLNEQDFLNTLSVMTGTLL